MVKWIKVTVDGKTFTVANDTFDFDVELNENTIRKCLQMVNREDSPSDYDICFIANNTILRIKPK